MRLYYHILRVVSIEIPPRRGLDIVEKYVCKYLEKNVSVGVGRCCLRAGPRKMESCERRGGTKRDKGLWHGTGRALPYATATFGRHMI